MLCCVTLPFRFPAMPGRDYSQLLEAMNELLAVLSSDGDEAAALRASFEGGDDLRITVVG